MATGLVVAGVHRSGTSIATRLAASIGLRLPPEGDLMPGNEGNPDGYWESDSLADFNDRLLLRWGHSWRRPPAAITPALLEQVADAREPAAAAFAAVFGAEPGWVWKDPRLAILLPFWEQVLGVNPVLFPYRAPQAVARSIAHRDGVTYMQGLAVWERCTRLALSALAGRRVAMTDYGRLLADPGGWRDALVEFCRDAGLAVEPGTESVDELMRTPGSSPDGWLSPQQAALAGLVQGLEGFHASLPAAELPPESEWVDDALVSLAGPPVLQREVQRLEGALHDEQERALEQIRRLEGELTAARSDAQVEVDRREAHIAELGAQLGALRGECDGLSRELRDITTSRGWRAVLRLRAAYHAVARRDAAKGG